MHITHYVCCRFLVWTTFGQPPWRRCVQCMTSVIQRPCSAWHSSSSLPSTPLRKGLPPTSPPPPFMMPSRCEAATGYTFHCIRPHDVQCRHHPCRPFCVATPGCKDHKSSLAQPCLPKSQKAAAKCCQQAQDTSPCNMYSFLNVHVCGIQHQQTIDLLASSLCFNNNCCTIAPSPPPHLRPPPPPHLQVFGSTCVTQQPTCLLEDVAIL